MAFFAKAYQLAWEDRRAADRVEVTFRASKSDKRLGVIVKRTRVPVRTGKGRVGGVKSNGALEILLDLLDMYHQLSGSAPLMQTRTATGWNVVTRTAATKALRKMVSS